MIPKVRGEWPVKQEVLKDERCARASLRGGLFNLQAPVNTVSERQEEKPAIYSSKSTVLHQLIIIAGLILAAPKGTKLLKTRTGAERLHVKSVGVGNGELKS